MDRSISHGPHGERRAAVRHELHTFEAPLSCRVNPGDEVRLANVSAVGAQVESAFALLPGRGLQLHMQGRRRRLVIEARVVWCTVMAVSKRHGVRFAAGLAFARWVNLASELESREPASPP